MIKILPQDDRILVKLDNIDEKQVGHITVSGVRSEKIRIGTIVDPGEGFLDHDGSRRKPKYKKGDRIMVTWWTGNVLQLFENEWYDTCHRILREDEVIAKVEE